MKFGIPTIIECKSLQENVKLCKQLGYDFVEINMNMPEYVGSKLDADKLNTLRSEWGVFFTLHLDENLNVCDFNKVVSEAYIDAVSEAILIAKKVKIPILNMHLSKGVYFTLPDRKVFLYNQHLDFYLESLAEFRDKCEKLIGDDNIKICIENTNGFEEFAKKGIELLLESPVFGLTFDVGHDFQLNNVDEPFIMQHERQLTHMHLHDTKGNSAHLPLGEGTIDLKESLRTAQKNNCTVVVEVKTAEGLRKSVAKMEELGYWKK